MKMELIEGSETSAIRTQTPGNYPKENILLLYCNSRPQMNVNSDNYISTFSRKVASFA